MYVPADESCLKQLLAAGAAVNVADINGTTALYQAAGQGRASAVQLLLATGANVNAACKLGFTPLNLAVQDMFGQTFRHNVQTVQALLSAGAAVDAGRFAPLIDAGEAAATAVDEESQVHVEINDCVMEHCSKNPVAADAMVDAAVRAALAGENRRGADGKYVHKRAVVRRLLLLAAEHDLAGAQAALQNHWPGAWIKEAAVLMADVLRDMWLEAEADVARLEARVPAVQQRWWCVLQQMVVCVAAAQAEVAAADDDEG